ncbi:tail fiber protein [Stappia sp. WLB 29]|uniref:phage tail protein n=1 Tax=Stappia sp. WLB 29 TaxID=2925220 RepID=UPI0020BFF9A4|nr:tail fiber protein [Stappia sp. WLB 29]
MSEPFLAEIKIMSFNFPPKGWAFCNGQLLPINQNQALFSLLGTTYGGNGTTNFALPDLRGRVPVHVGSGFTLGQHAGEASHTLTTPEMPEHNHLPMASGTAVDTNTPTSNYLGNNLGLLYGPLANSGTMSPSSLSNVGGSQAHQNMQPFLTLNFCIALQGIFPSPN